MYSYSNYINSNISTLHHVVYRDSIEGRYNIMRYVSKRSNSSFTVDYDFNGNIHLLYNTILNDSSRIYYTYFNPFKNSWLRDPILMSQNENHNENPYLLVDSLDNIHGIWWEKNTKTYKLKYFRKSLSGRERFKWLEVNLNIESFVPKGILKEEKESLYLIYGDIENSFIIKSLDYGLNWVKFDEKLEAKIKKEDLPKENISRPKVIASDLVDRKIIEENIIENKIDEPKDTLPVREDINNIELEQILYQQKELKMLLNNIMEEVLYIKSKITSLEESQKASFIKRLFS